MIVKTECDMCYGLRWIWTSYFGTEKTLCPKCNGSGYIEYYDGVNNENM